MKQTLLLFFLGFFTMTAFGQFSPDGADIAEKSFFTTPHSEQPQFNITIYPNPATDFISVSNEDKLSEIAIFNLVGRKLKTYPVEEGARYDVSDLPAGMYLVQVRDLHKKIVTTQRISKR